MYRQEKLEKLGGVYWEAYGKKRVYFDSQELIDFKVEYYNTGNVKYAELDGEKISNGKARKLLYKLDTGKLYYDFEKEDFFCTVPGEIREKIIEKLMLKIKD